MSKNSQQKKAKHFLALHKQNKLLVLPNIWNPITARILEAKGFPSAATASAAISSSLGYQDGEKIKLSTHLDIIRRIVDSVNIAVTADIESGYASNISELKESIKPHRHRLNLPFSRRIPGNNSLLLKRVKRY